MPHPLLIHPRPIPGESITSFLMRVSHENGIPFVGLWSEFNDKFRKTHLKDVHQLDIDPFRVCDVPVFMQLLMLNDPVILNQMTFQPLFAKFLDNEELESDKTRRDFCQGVIDTAHRRYCPACLVENLAYKLLWQVKEIKVCDVHGIGLESKCPHCGCEQDLVHDGLAQAKCQKCAGSLVAGGGVKTVNMPYANEQLQIYKEWRALIDPKTRIVPDVVGSRRKSMAIVLLFVAQQGGDRVDTSKIKVITNEYANKLLRFVRDQNRPKRPTLPFILGVLRKLGVSIGTFSQISVSKDYIQSVCSPVSSTVVMPGNCIAPWCRTFGTSFGMKQTNIVNKEKKGFNGELYRNLYICMECCLHYGYSRETGKWGELEGIVEYGWRQILPRLNQGISKRQISISLGITSYKITQMAGYFARTGLLAETLLKDYLPPEGIHADLVPYFTQVHHQGTLIYQACKRFGWTKSQFWYLYYQPEVQNYLFIVTHRRRGTYKSQDEKASSYWRERFTHELEKDLHDGKKPELEDIANRIGCTKETITRYKLSRILSEARYKYDLQLKDYYWSITKEFVQEKLSKNQRIILKEYHATIGKSEKWINKRYPEILTWVKEQIPIASQNHKNAVLLQRIADAKAIVRELQAAGEPYGLTHVAERMGLNLSTICYYKELGDAIREAAVSTET